MITLLVAVISISFLYVPKLAVLLSSVLWLFMLMLVSYKVFGPVAMGVVLLIYALAVILYCTRTASESVSRSSSKLELSSETSGLASTQSESVISKTNLTLANPTNDDKAEASVGSSAGISSVGENSPCTKDASLISEVGYGKAKRSVSFQGGVELPSESSLFSTASSAAMDSKASIYSSASFGRSYVDGSGKGVDEPNSGRTIARKARHRAFRARQNNNFVFVVLIVSTFFVCVWKYTLFQILFAFIVFLLIWQFIYPKFRPYINLAWTKLSSIRTPTGSVIFPPPVAVIGQAVYKLDRLVLSLAIQWVGDIVTMCIVVGLLVTLFVASIMLLLQVQVELSHYLAESVVLWNRTMEANPDINQ